MIVHNYQNIIIHVNDETCCSTCWMLELFCYAHILADMLAAVAAAGMVFALCIGETADCIRASCLCSHAPCLMLEVTNFPGDMA